MRRLMSHTGKRTRTGECNSPDRSSNVMCGLREGNRTLGATLHAIHRSITLSLLSSFRRAHLLHDGTGCNRSSCLALFSSLLLSQATLSLFPLFLSPSLWSVLKRGEKSHRFALSCSWGARAVSGDSASTSITLCFQTGAFLIGRLGETSTAASMTLSQSQPFESWHFHEWVRCTHTFSEYFHIHTWIKYYKTITPGKKTRPGDYI